VTVAREIRCPDCDGVAHLVTQLASEPDEHGEMDVVEPGDVLTYTCGDCFSRWDVVLDEGDLSEDD